MSDQFEMPLRSSDPSGGFFLEHMEDVQHVLEANRVDSAIGVAAEVISNLKNPAPKAFEGLGVGGVIPELHFKKGLADHPRECSR
jgi:hypothetical protein